VVVSGSLSSEQQAKLLARTQVAKYYAEPSLTRECTAVKYTSSRQWSLNTATEATEERPMKSFGRKETWSAGFKYTWKKMGEWQHERGLAKLH